MSSAKGCGGWRAASSDAAGRLFTRTLVSGRERSGAPGIEVGEQGGRPRPGAPECAECDGESEEPDQDRDAEHPRAARARSRAEGPVEGPSPLRPAARTSTATTPTTATGSAGERRATTSTVTTAMATRPTPSTGTLRFGDRDDGGAQGAVVESADDDAR